MICLFIVFALQFVQGCYSEQFNTVIAVTNSTKFDGDCHIGSHSRHTIDELSTLNVYNGTEFRFCSPFLLLKSTISYSNVSDISFVGFNFTKLVCNIPNIGFELNNVKNVEIRNIDIESCGRIAKVESKHDFKAGLTIYNSTNISIENVGIKNNSGTGMALFYNSGLIDISNCTFEGNGVDGKTGGNGVYVETMFRHSSYNVSNYPAYYSFVNCIFLYNKAVTGNENTIDYDDVRFDNGGGMCVHVNGSNNVNIFVSDSLFIQNKAEKYGGGLYIRYRDKCKNNTITIIRTNFELNTAKYGGGIYFGYLYSPDLKHTPQNSQYILSHVTFTGNIADYGGGFSLFSTKTPNSDSNNNVRLENCTWISNEGQYGAAVAILPNAWYINTPGYLPRPVFVNSTFTRNTATCKSLPNNTSQNFKEYSRGLGTFYCSKHNISFEKLAQFESNNGSAIVFDYCVGIFTTNSLIRFENNIGFRGGAIQVLTSVLYVKAGSMLQFHGNKAEDKGGAIYEHTTSALFHHYSQTCFIDNSENLDRTDKDRKITISFVNNSANQYGHSIFVSSLIPCHNRFKTLGMNILNMSEIFKRIGTFTYFPIGRQFELATAANHSKIINETSWSIHRPFIPGKEQRLPISNIDDFGQDVQANYIITIDKPCIKANEYYTSISNNNLSLFGRGTDIATVTLTDISPRQNAISFNVTMLSCPPGFILDQSQLRSCICSLGTDESYVGIDSCNLTLFRAYSKQGFWFGYREDETENENSLFSGHCPRGFCLPCKNNLLPGTANRQALNDIMCSDSRTGTLCGRCVNDSTVYYHSLKFKCGADSLCHLGWLFYILSEIVPVTIMFLVIIFLNIPLTSGLINRFIFYCQVIEVVRLLSDNLIHSSESIRNIDHIYSLIYSMFSLDFFNHDSMSFCLWNTNKAIDIIVFKCVTILYSFLLVIFVAFGLEKCSMKCYGSKLSHFSQFTKHLHFHGSIIHGLSAFLILCYSQCARSFVLLLSFVSVHRKGSPNSNTLVYYDGAIEWLSKEHLPYALPAIVLGVFVLIIPPIILIIYPLHNKVLSFLKLSEVRCMQSLFRPLDKQKPFFDSFQGSFKDEFRFFSGLYLIYRFFIVINIVWNYIHDSLFYLVIQILIMLSIHAICQPYKLRLHNIIDTLLFSNLAVIIAITYYSLTYSVTPFMTNINTTGLSVINCILIILPMVVAVSALIFVIVRECWKKIWSKNQYEERVEMIEFNDDEFPDRGGLYESYKPQ